MKLPARHLDLRIQRFAEWAFGLTGLPNLRIIAIGNFSLIEDNHYPIFLCKNVDPSVSSMVSSRPSPLRCSCRRMTKADVALQDLIEEHMDMFTACPPDVEEREFESELDDSEGDFEDEFEDGWDDDPDDDPENDPEDLEDISEDDLPDLEDSFD